ncbi:MAG: hypothetical protein ABI759_00885, partial [Candidatus Solibacter sp.]
RERILAEPELFLKTQRLAVPATPAAVADSARSGALIPFEVGHRSAAMWGRIPLGSGASFGL